MSIKNHINHATLKITYPRITSHIPVFLHREQAFFNAIPEHITQDPDMWSMCDFVDVQNKSMGRSIKELVVLSEHHVQSCVVRILRLLIYFYRECLTCCHVVYLGHHIWLSE